MCIIHRNILVSDVIMEVVSSHMGFSVRYLYKMMDLFLTIFSKNVAVVAV